MTDETNDPKKPRTPAAKKAAPKKRVQNPAPKNNTPTPHGKKAAARKVAAKKATNAKASAGKATPPAQNGKQPATPAPKGKQSPAKGKTKPDPAKAKENAAASVAALLGDAKRAIGRPTKYSDDIIPQMLAYFNIETERIEEGDPIVNKEGEVQKDKDGNVLTEKKVVVNKYPTLERFASKIGVSRDTLFTWATAKTEDGAPLHPEFSDTYTRCKDLATALLVEGGLEGNYDARIVQFALKNIGGWRDQIDTHIEGNITTTSQEKLDDIYNAGMARSRAAEAAAKARTLAGVVPGQGAAVVVPVVRPDPYDEDEEADEHGDD